MSRSLCSVVLVLSFFVGGCLQPGGVLCDNGRTCPSDTVCDDTHGTCVEKAQLKACASLAEGDPCPVHESTDGQCDQGICVLRRCGDGILEAPEQCDGEKIIAGADCTDLGFYETGTPTCNSACSFDVQPETTACKGYCGDGELTKGIEVCETGMSNVSSCVELGFGAGTLGCVECRADVRPCTTFGWQLEALDGAPIRLRGTAANDVFALTSGDNGKSKLLHFDGSTWSADLLAPCTLPQTINFYVSELWVASPGLAFASGDDILIRATTTTCETFPLPAGAGAFASIDAIWADSATDAWVTTLDDVWHFDGSTWTSLLTISGSDRFESLWGTGPTNIYVTIYDDVYASTLKHYDGSSWTTIDPGLPENKIIWGTSPTDIYVGGKHTAAIRHYDGVSWSDVRPLPPSAGGSVGFGYGIYEGSSTSDGRLYAASGGFPKAHAFVFDGVSWTDLDLPQGFGPPLFAAPGGQLFSAAQAVGKLARFEGTGRFDVMNQSVGGDLAINASDDIYARAAGLLAHWDGASWQPENSTIIGPYLFYTAVDVSPSGTAFALVYGTPPGDPGKTGLYKRGSDGNWTQYTNVTGNPEKLVALADNNVLVMEGGRIIKWASGTGTQPEITIAGPSGFLSQDMWATSATDIYVVGYTQDTSAVNHSVILHYNGAAWTTQTTPVDVGLLRRVHGYSPTEVYVTGDTGVLLKGNGNGVWTVVETPPGAKVRDAWGPPTDMFIGTSDGLFRTTNGTRWDRVSLGSEVEAVRVHTTGSVIEVLDGSGNFHEIVRLAPWE